MIQRKKFEKNKELLFTLYSDQDCTNEKEQDFAKQRIKFKVSLCDQCQLFASERRKKKIEQLKTKIFQNILQFSQLTYIPG